MRSIHFHDKYYVGFQKSRYDSSEAFRILGFATQITNDKSFEKRKETVDRWSDKQIQAITFENIPMTGFKISDVVSRYHTDNKKYRVEDPRGFELEIDVYNLMEIIKCHTIVNGIIVEPMLWGRINIDNYLISPNSEEYKYHKSEKKIGALTPGMLFKNKAGNVIYKYEGKYAYNLNGYNVERHDPNRYSYSLSNGNAGVSTTISTVHSKKQDKPVFVYSEFLIDEDGKTKFNKGYRSDVEPIQKCNIVVRKSEIKDLVYISAVECEFINSFKLPIGAPLIEIDYGYHNKIGDEFINRTNYSVYNSVSISNNTVITLFASKKESLDAPYLNQEEVLEMFKSEISKKMNFHGGYGDRPEYKNYNGNIIYKHSIDKRID